MNKKSGLVEKQVSEIIGKVRREGDRALEFFTKKFDGLEVQARAFSVSKKKMKDSYNRIPSSVRSALLLAKERIEFFHREEFKRINKGWTVNHNGVTVGQKVSAIESVGLYVPGGRYCYPSTVLMTSIPARVAGVKKIMMVTPPKNLKDEILAAAYICGIDQCLSVGGPAAVAALAYGTRTVPKVRKIVGPGNEYVTEAKRQVFGQVGIDGLAGPSEIVVWADSSANTLKVALNLLAQAEHDPQSRGILLSTQKEVLEKMKRDVPKEFLNQIKFGFKKSEQDVIDEINNIAPEHLYLAIKNPKKVLPKIQNAGAIFLGENSPVPLGDYVAGPSHVLPTGATAKFSSGLSVKDFLKSSSIIENKTKVSSDLFQAGKILAEVEGLHYHSLALLG